MTGVVAVVMSVTLLFSEFATALFFIGAGFVSLGMGVAVMVLTVLLAKTCVPWLTRRMGAFLLRRTNR